MKALAALAGVAAAGAAAGLSFVSAPAHAAAVSGTPQLNCTFTVHGRYRAAAQLTPFLLESLGVPASVTTTVLDNLAARAHFFPADWNVRCIGVNTGAPTRSTVGGRPLPPDPYIACQMNTTAPARNTRYRITTGLLQQLGVPPSDWGIVTGSFGQLLSRMPRAWGVACTLHGAAGAP